MNKAIEYKAEWLDNFGIGIILITKQRLFGQDFNFGINDFYAGNGLTLSSSPDYSMELEYYKEYKKLLRKFYVLNELVKNEHKPILVNRVEYYRINEALAEYNAYVTRKENSFLKREKPNYLCSLHKKSETCLAENPNSEKLTAIRMLHETYGIPVPSGYCFLCELEKR